MRRAELSGKARATNAWEVFKYLDKNMPQPQPINKQHTQFQLNRRHQLYVVKEANLTEEMRTWSRDKVIFLRTPKGEKNGNNIDGMRKIYQLKATKQMIGRTIQYRNITCACSNCVQSNYDACLTNSAWTTIDLERRERRQAQRRCEFCRATPTMKVVALWKKKKTIMTILMAQYVGRKYERSLQNKG